MEDRELTNVERELRGYLSAHLDRLPVRSAPDLSPSANSWLRTVAAVPATIIVILIAIGSGLALAEWRAQRVALDQPQAASGGVPGPLALAGGTPTAVFGLVSTSVNTLFVRSEITEAPVLTINSALPQVAVSPNGHEIAYWRVLPNRQGQAASELIRSDLTDPASRDRVVMGTPSGEVPGQIIWSSDGTGLIANTHSAPLRGPVVQGSDAGTSTTHTSWFTIDVASGKVTELAPGFEGVVSTVYAWDRQRDLITGSGLYAGQNTFTALQGVRITSHTIPSGAAVGAADVYGRSVVLILAGACKGPATTARCPALEIRDQVTFATITVSPLGEATSDFPDVVFRARSEDLIVQLPLQNGDARVELWSDLGRGPHQVLASYTQNLRFTGRRELVLPRADGSAVFLLKFDDSAGGRWFGELVGFAPDGTNRGGKDPQHTPFEILTGGNPLASVVLDPAFVRAMELPHPSSQPRPADATLPTSGNTSEAAIRAVLGSPTGATFAQFPKTIGAQACEIRGGGPYPGILVSGSCRTDAKAVGSSYIVSFTFVWAAAQFHPAGAPNSGELQHTWPFLVDPSGAVVPEPDAGDFPPQYVR